MFCAGYVYHQTLLEDDWSLFPRTGIAVLHIAILTNNVQHVELLLLDEFVWTDLNGLPDAFAPISLAAYTGFKEIFELLLRYGTFINEYPDDHSPCVYETLPCTALVLAAKGKHLDVIGDSLVNGADLRESVATCLTATGNDTLVDILMTS
jgi:hypothetical protein